MEYCLCFSLLFSEGAAISLEFFPFACRLLVPKTDVQKLGWHFWLGGFGELQPSRSTLLSGGGLLCWKAACFLFVVFYQCCE